MEDIIFNKREDETPIMVTEPETTEVVPSVEPNDIVIPESPEGCEGVLPCDCPTCDTPTCNCPTCDCNTENIPTENLTIGEFFGTLIESIPITWRYHLKSRKHSTHVILEEYYEDAQEIIDRIIESYQGKFNVILEYGNRIFDNGKEDILYLSELRDFVQNGRDMFDDIVSSSEIMSEIDTLLSLLDSTLYKLRNLTESKKPFKTFEEFINESNNIKLDTFKNKTIYWGLRKIDGVYYMMFGKDKDMYLYDKKSIHVYNPEQFDWECHWCVCTEFRREYDLSDFQDGTYRMFNLKTNKPMETKEEAKSFEEEMKKRFPKWEKTSFKGYIGPDGEHFFSSKVFFDCHFDKESKECFIGISDEKQLNNNTEFSDRKSKNIEKKTNYKLKQSDSSECVYVIQKINSEKELDKFINELTEKFPRWKRCELFKDMF